MKKLLILVLLLTACKPTFDGEEPFIVRKIYMLKSECLYESAPDLGFYAPCNLYNVGDTVTLKNIK